ncbi:hypothetical protein [Clostridioides difficile]|uniref:hypothetical protein n=1 Tax=Clostridioides sp. ZZV14-6387 TaxID=2811497 RepID=UPI0007BB061D|nr:hypothetical protein [Clostridioides difficile]NJK13503.1 hypothetical protein [Clostridioides difficile]CZR97811.1 hypothetical protein CDFC105_62604 [Clostridioides difficile]CZS01940.1 hypothetical protein CDFC105_70736 [Clostridioides difficile]
MKTSIINTLVLKNIDANLNNALVELSEKIKTYFDSSEASVQELQNRITELTNQLSQRKKYAKGGRIFSANILTIVGLDFKPSAVNLYFQIDTTFQEGVSNNNYKGVKSNGILLDFYAQEYYYSGRYRTSSGSRESSSIIFTNNGFTIKRDVYDLKKLTNVQWEAWS